jgi:predicted dehydrogenase
MLEDKKIRLAIAGLGGYAGQILQFVMQHAESVRPAFELVAVCDPKPDAHPEKLETLQAKGVEVFNDFHAMIDESKLDAVWLPVPIELHVPFAKYALQRGLAVLIEKPVAGTVQEVDELIEARDAADRPVLIGFQDVYDQHTPIIKNRLLSGQDGPLRQASITACWPRTDQYFSRNNWAGRQKSGNTWVLDSPINNALSHPVNLALFLLGNSPETSAAPVRIEAELYRAVRIENYDTVSARIHFDSGPPLLLLLTHASSKQDGPWVRLQFDKGFIERTNDKARLVIDGQSQPIGDGSNKRVQMLQGFANAIRGVEDPSIAQATLETSRVHTLLINAISEATPIVDVPEDELETIDREDGQILAIRDIAEVFQRCGEEGLMLHESGAYPFTSPPATIDLTDYRQFKGVAESAVGSSMG